MFNKIETIRIIRMFTSLHLAEAKQLAEKWMDTYSYSDLFTPSPESVVRLAALCRNISDGKIIYENGDFCLFSPLTTDTIRTMIVTQ